MISERDMKILNARISFLVSNIDYHKDKLAELEGELKGLNELIKEKS